VPEPSNTPTASYRVVNGDYFHAMGISVLRGRVFSAGDDRSAPSAGVVNHSLAVAYFDGKDPTCQVIQTRDDTIHIVGMVADVALRNVEDKAPPTLYLPFARNREQHQRGRPRNGVAGVDGRRLRDALSSIDASAAMTPVAMETS
jgi:hypothetical protein